MKKLSILLVTGIISCWILRVSAQSRITISENFDGNNNTFTSTPTSAWKIDSNYYASAHNSIRGVVPNMPGDSIVLTSQVYDFSDYDYVYLQFKHICKIAFSDIVRIEYRISGQSWEAIPNGAYLGGAQNYQAGFNYRSYAEWTSSDSLGLPSQLWWKEELFDVSVETAGESGIQFRFVLKHGNNPGTQIFYGWLIDDIEVSATNYDLRKPVVTFLAPLIKDTVYNGGPWEINAKVKSATGIPVETPTLVYTVTHNGVSTTDTLTMTMIGGDSLWRATIPSAVLGAEISYTITGIDTNKNTGSATLRFVILNSNPEYGNNSVALVSIDSPIERQTLGGVSTPITVSIHNTGTAPLTLATIKWSVNGTENTYQWTGNLPWSVTASVNLNNYTPSLDAYDTIIVWVSNPNNTTDPATDDDTLKVISYGCLNSISGDYNIGSSFAIKSVPDFLAILKYCHPVGNIRLLLEAGTYTDNWDLTNINNLLGNYSLTITSQTKNKSSVTLAPATGVGILINNANNIILTDITIDVSTTGTYGIQLAGVCTNLVIDRCDILGRLTGNSATTAYYPVYKDAYTAGSLANISITNCKIQGGYYGIYLYGASNNYCQNITIDSNTITDQYQGGISLSYVNVNSISYNQVNPRSTAQGIAWYGFNFYNISDGGNIIGNRIKADNSGITNSLNGIYINTISKALVANNEIYLNSMANQTYGMYLNSSNGVDYLHNSVLLTSPATSTSTLFRALLLSQSTSSTPTLTTLKNNHFVVNGGSGAQVVYIMSALDTTFVKYNDIGYNNYYSSGNLAYAGRDIPTLAQWKQLFISDQHSVSILPNYNNLSTSLELTDYTPFFVSPNMKVAKDITGTLRTGITSIGCYHGIAPLTVNASLFDVYGWRNGSVFNGVDTVKAILLNLGTTSITTANIGWSYNGVTKTAVPWSGNLSTGQSDTIVLGTITYSTAGIYTLSAWINNLGTLTDNYKGDDTLTVSDTICTAPVNGVYTIGGTNGAFSSLSEFCEVLTICGSDGDITLELEMGLYNENINLSNMSPYLGNNKLTITSVTHTATDVTLVTNSVGITLGENKNITIKDITIDATAGRYAIEFISTCTNILIRDCRLLSSITTTSTTTAPIYKAPDRGMTDSIFIIHNFIEGGYYGCYFYGGTSSSAYGTNVVFDSNTVINQYYHGTSSYWVDFISCSYNTIQSRITSAGGTWYALYMSSCNGPIIGNKIMQRSTSITMPMGISAKTYNLYNATDTGLIANNEIIINTTWGKYPGIYIEYAYTKILHNSIYVSDTTGDAYGIYFSGSNTDWYAVRNNNIVVEGSDAYPLYFNSVVYLKYYDIDYNNIYAPKYVAYAGTNGNMVSMANWQQIMPSDLNSISINPAVIDKTIDLKLSNYREFSCPSLPNVSVDIDGNSRTGITSMGCYQELNAYMVDARLVTMYNPPSYSVGTSDTIRVILLNKGRTALSQATLNWSINDNSQTPVPVSWQTPLASAALDTISIGVYTHNVAGDYTIKIWISALGALPNDYPDDDTVYISGYNCTASYAGEYTVGASGNFTSIREALEKIQICGANDNVTLKLYGTYQEDINLKYISLYMGNHTLTLTSSTGVRSDAIIETQAAGIEFYNSNNIVIKDITINTRIKNTHGINISGDCDNVVITRCDILSDTVGTSAFSTNNPINKPMTTGRANNITITHNLLEGGAYGIQFYAGTGSADYGTNIVIDSNTIIKQASRGVTANYTDFTSLSGNTIKSRVYNAAISWTGLNLPNCNGNVIANRIIQQSTSITMPTGISLESFNYNNTTDTGVIANNEIILNMTMSYRGIYANYYTRAKIVHNSIYISGTGAARGIDIYNFTGNYMVIKNNNIVMTSTNAHPIYLNSITNLRYDMDYNNMYAPTYAGYAAGNKATINDWQNTVTSDKHSVSTLPSFTNVTASLELSNYTGLLCPSFPEAPQDIDGYFRANVTTIGAYNGLTPALDLGMERIIRSDTSVTYPDPVPTSIEIANMGSHDKIDSATFGWSVNGIVQLPCKWTPTTPLAVGGKAVIPVGAFDAGRSNTFDISVWVESVNGRKDSVVVNDTVRTAVRVYCTGTNLSVQSIERLVAEGLSCIDDYTSLNTVLSNTGTVDYDFSAHPVRVYVEVTQPITFSLDTLISSGILQSGDLMPLTLTDTFPIIAAGNYDLKVWLDSISGIVYDDTLLEYYVSGKFGLPIDADFSGGVLPIEFVSKEFNTTYKWEIVTQGTGIDAAVTPQFGTGMLAYKGSPGSISTLTTQQLDLSRTDQPSLSFWYFHDTVPCEDYTDVYLTVDGGTTYSTLFSITKYDAVYGWRQYSRDLPPHAVNQCVRIVFEAMEKSRGGDVTQYIDRIRITAKRDIALAEILTSGLSACDMENKEWKVVLKNNEDPVLDYSVTPIDVTLEIVGTGEIFTQRLTSDILEGSSSDTVTLAPTFNFAKGTYPVKAYFTSVLDDTPLNDTLVTTIVINPDLSVQLIKISAPNACLAEKSQVWQEVILTNTGNMDLSNIELVLQIDTGDIVIAPYTILTETYTGTIPVMENDTYRFTTPYTVPWNASYSVRVTANLECNITLSDNIDQITECVDTKDLEIVSIDNPLSSSSADNAGSSVQVIATVGNRSDLYPFNNGVSITVWVRNSQGVQTDRFTETTGAIGTLSTISHTFTQSYTVPEDTVYYLTVYIESNDIYPDNDTIRIKRTTDYTGINAIGSNVFALGQNIPNPATNSTCIDYSVPEAGEVIFHVHSISGQLLYSQSIDTKRGANSIELNTTTFAAGVYFYSMEYKGQRLVRQLIIK